MLYRILILFIFSIVVSSCTILDRGDDEIADLEPVPEEQASEPSILIDDEEIRRKMENN